MEENEFGYVDNRPFSECHTDKQSLAIIQMNENGIEFKINGIDKYDIERDYGKELYGIDSRLNSITAFNLKGQRTTYSAISSTVLSSDFYLVGFNKSEKIKHITKETKLSKIKYFHEELNNIFGNDSYIVKRYFDAKNEQLNQLKQVKINAKKKNKQKVGDIIISNNKISVYLNSDFKYMHKHGKKEEFSISDESSMDLVFQRGIDLGQAYEYVKLLDSTIHMLTLTNKRHKKIMLYDYRHNKYFLKDRKMLMNNTKKYKNIYNFTKHQKRFENFINIFSILCDYNKNSKNAIFPFLEYDIQESSIEISFLEYYKALEYVEYEKQKKKGRGKNKTFLKVLLKEYSRTKEVFFSNQNINEIEEEIRALRNYYSHEGYYIDNLSLPIPTDTPKRYKLIDMKWIFNVAKFVKIIAYLELYKLCNVEINEIDIIYQL